MSGRFKKHYRRQRLKKFQCLITAENRSCIMFFENRPFNYLASIKSKMKVLLIQYINHKFEAKISLIHVQIYTFNCKYNLFRLLRTRDTEITGAKTRPSKGIASVEMCIHLVLSSNLIDATYTGNSTKSVFTELFLYYGFLINQIKYVIICNPFQLFISQNLYIIIRNWI